jgi:hypothetical protein
LSPLRLFSILQKHPNSMWCSILKDVLSRRYFPFFFVFCSMFIELNWIELNWIVG